MPYARGRFKAGMKSRKGSRSGSRGSRKSSRFRDRYSTLRNGPSPFPASLRPGQGSYSRTAFARAAVRADLEVKNLDTELKFSNATTPGTGTATLTFTTAAAATNMYQNSTLVTDKPGSLVNIPQNSTANGREGRKVVVKGIQYCLNLRQTGAAAAADTSQTMRLILVLDKQCNGSPIATADLFQDNTANVNALYNLNNAARFTVLADEPIALNSTAVLGGAGVAVQKMHTTKLVCNIPLEFSGIDGKTSEIRSNNVNLFIIGSGAGTVTATGFARVLYVG